MKHVGIKRLIGPLVCFALAACGRDTHDSGGGPSAWQKAFLPRLATETSLDARYRFSDTWDAWGQWSGRNAQRKLDEALDLQYAASVVLVGISREIAPWGTDLESPLRRIHIAVIGAVGYNRTDYRLADDYTSIKAKNGTATAAAGAEIRMPLVDNLWLTVRDLGRVEALKIDDLDVHGLLLLNSTSVGVNYAF